ncbi:MAG: ribose ABC transporter substrate-binding protein RbsB [Brevinemataceae bacterium]
MKKILSLLMLFVIITACAKKSNTPTLGLVVSTLNNPFFVDLKNGAEAKAKELGYKITSLDSQNDVAKELANIEDLISADVAAILINPTDSESSARAAKLAIDANIPVISLDRNLNGVTVTTHVASDNILGGQMAAELISRLIKPNDKIIELEGILGTSAARERGQGFNKKAAELGLNIAVKQPANFDRSMGLTVTENLLQIHPDAKAIFAHNDEMALGAQRAVKDTGLNMIIVGFDATPDAITAVASGELTATIAQQPALIGALGVENAVKAINKEEIDSFIPVELKLITKE